MCRHGRNTGPWIVYWECRALRYRKKGSRRRQTNLIGHRREILRFQLTFSDGTRRNLCLKCYALYPFNLVLWKQTAVRFWQRVRCLADWKVKSRRYLQYLQSGIFPTSEQFRRKRWIFADSRHWRWRDSCIVFFSLLFWGRINISWSSWKSL